MRKAVAVVLSAVLMTSSVFASFPDVSDTFWGKDVITKWTDLDIVKGDNSGNFRPNDNITRAEFSVILNKLMKYNKATENQFEDVKSSDWYYEDIGALAQAGIMAGTEGNALPKQNITRQDAVVLMAKAFNIAPIDNEYGFSDSKEISSYAKGYINAMAKLGYIQGRENNTFCPKTNLTRTEALAIADKLVAKLVNKEGTYTENIEGNMLINVADVTLKDTEIKGNLYIAEGVGDGEIYINNTKIEGDLIVEGGGNNSIYIVDSHVEGKLHLNKRDGNVRVKASGETNIEKAVIANGATLDTAEVTGEGIKNVELSENLTNENTVKLVGEFKTVESKAENVVVEVEGKIETVKLEKPATIEGNVEIAKTEVAEGVEANIKGEVVTSKTETKVEEKTEEKKEEEKPSSSGGGGGSSSGGSSSSNKEEEIIGYSFAVITFNWKADESQDGNYHFMMEDLFVGKPIEYITASLEGITSTSGKTIDSLKDGDIIAYASTATNKFEKIIVVDSAKAEIFPGYSIITGNGVSLVDADKIKKNDVIINLQDTVRIWYQNENLGITEVLSGKESIIDEKKTIIDSEGEYVIYSTKDTNEAKAIIINNKEDLIENYQLGMVKKVVGEETLDGKKVLKLKVIDKDGTTKTYTLVGSEGDYQISKIPTLGESITEFEEGMIVSFISDEEFNVLDTEMVALTNLAEENGEISGKGYYYDVLKASALEDYHIDYDNETIYAKSYTDESLIFNKAGESEDKYEVVKAGFKAIVNSDDETIVNDEDEYIISSCFGDILCVVVDGDEFYYTNRPDYAFVINLDMVKDDIYEVTLYNEGHEMVYETNGINLEFGEYDFIKYRITNSGKLNVDESVSILATDEIVLLDKNQDITGKINLDEILVNKEIATAYGLSKKQITVDVVTSSKVKFDEVDGVALDSIGFEKDDGEFNGVIYDLTDIENPQMMEDLYAIENKSVIAIDSNDNNKADVIIVLKKDKVNSDYLEDDRSLGLIKSVGNEVIAENGNMAFELNILTQDGETKRYKVVGDGNTNYNIGKVTTMAGPIIENFEAGMLLAYKESENSEIIDSKIVVINDGSAGVSSAELGNLTVKVGSEISNVDYDDETIDNLNFTSETVIFNKAGTVIDEYEVVKAGFAAIVNKNDETIVNDEDEFVISSCFGDILCVVVDGDEFYYTNRASYAQIIDISTEDGEIFTVTLYENGEERMYETSKSDIPFRTSDFIKYKLTSDERLDVDNSQCIIDINTISKLDRTGDLTKEIYRNDLMINIDSAYLTKSHLVVADITGNGYIEFDEVDGEKLSSIKYEKDENGEFDAMIYDFRSAGNPTMIEDYEALIGRVAFPIDSNGNDKVDIFVVINKDDKRIVQYGYVEQIMINEEGTYDVVIYKEGEQLSYKTTTSTLNFDEGDFVKYKIRTGNGKMDSSDSEVLIDVSEILKLDNDANLFEYVAQDKILQVVNLDNPFLSKEISIIGEVTNTSVKFINVNREDIMEVDFEGGSEEDLGVIWYTGVIYDLSEIGEFKMVTDINELLGKAVLALDVNNNNKADIFVIVEDNITLSPIEVKPYAFVMDVELYKEDAWKVTLYNDGQELSYETNGINLEFNQGDFIKYKITDSGKLNLAESKSVIKVKELNLLNSNVDLIQYIEMDELLLDRTAVAYDLTKKHITVNEPKSSRVTFDEVENKNGVAETLDSISFDRDDDVFTGIIYDLTDIEEPQMVTDIANIDGKAVFAIDIDENNRADIFVMVRR